MKTYHYFISFEILTGFGSILMSAFWTYKKKEERAPIKETIDSFFNDKEKVVALKDTIGMKNLNEIHIKTQIDKGAIKNMYFGETTPLDTSKTVFSREGSANVYFTPNISGKLLH